MTIAKTYKQTLHDWTSKCRCVQQLVDVKDRRRDQLSIIARMIEITKEGALKTQIMYRANLSYTQLKEYLDLLLEKELVAQINIEEKEVYKITQRGRDFLQTHRELKRLIEKNPDKSAIF